MADPIQIGQLYEVRFVCKLANQYAVNVRHFRVTTIVSGQPTTDTFAGGLEAKFAPLFKACLSVRATWYGLGSRRVLPTQSLETISAAARGPGTVVGDALSTQTAAVITLRTPLPGKKFRGRMYVPFPSETDNDLDARPTAAYLANTNALSLPLMQSTTYTIGADSFTAVPSIFHRALQTETTIVLAYTRPDWGTQRRRSQINRPDRSPIG